jgi:hypothetical protein
MALFSKLRRLPRMRHFVVEVLTVVAVEALEQDLLG